MTLTIEKDKCYTAADFFEWEPDSGERYELADGGAFMMSGCSRRHEEINDNLFTLIRNFLKGKPCCVYSENFAVRLFPESGRKDNCVFLPDIFVVCDRKKLDKQACNGAPDLIIEVLSPSTARFDRLVKFNKYLEAGVKEYWIVDPDINTIQVHILQNKRYVTSVYNDEAEIDVLSLPGLTINTRDIFPAEDEEEKGSG